MPRHDFEHILNSIEGLSENPLPQIARSLTGQDAFRLWVERYRVIYAINNEDLLSDPNYFASENFFKDLKFRLRMEAKMLKPAFMKQLKLNDRYLDEAQSKRRTAMRSIIRAGQDVVASLK